MARALNHSSDERNTRSANYIYVGNLSYDTDENDLGSYFHDNCGNVSRVRIIYDRQTRQSRGFGFVYFNTSESYESALNLKSCQLHGRDLRISPGDSKDSKSTNSVQMATQAGPGKTTVVHCKKSKYDVYIGRPSDWGNPFVIGKNGDRADVIRKYRQWIMREPELIARAKTELRGQRIACWCKPEDCHGDVLAELADAE